MRQMQDYKRNLPIPEVPGIEISNPVSVIIQSMVSLYYSRSTYVVICFREASTLFPLTNKHEVFSPTISFFSDE